MLLFCISFYRYYSFALTMIIYCIYKDIKEIACEYVQKLGKDHSSITHDIMK